MDAFMVDELTSRRTVLFGIDAERTVRGFVLTSEEMSTAQRMVNNILFEFDAKIIDNTFRWVPIFGCTDGRLRHILELTIWKTTHEE